MSSSNTRVALVTGGGTGIGAAITARLAADGVRVFAVQRTIDEAEEAEQVFKTHPAAEHIHVGAYDLSTGRGCARAVAECVAGFGDLDILVNNAGVTGEAAIGPVATIDDGQIDRIIDTNLKAPLRLARDALHYLIARGGVIVNISSVAEFQAQAEAPAYVASKAGLGGLTRALAYDLGPHGVRVVCVAPGDVATQTSRSPGLQAKRAHVSWGKTTPLGYSAEPEDVANAVRWLVSDNARYITGSTIIIDGGMTSY